MAKVKADYIKEAEALGLEVNAKSTVADIKAAIDAEVLKAKAKHDKGETKEEPSEEKETKVTKAGKRSAKALREAEEEEERLEKAEKVKKGEEKPEGAVEKKGPIPVARPKIERRSKNYRAAHDKLGDKEPKELAAALKLAVETSNTKFDSTVEMHVRLEVDPKQADQNIRDSLILPNGTGKTVKVAVFAPADEHKAAKDAGADIVAEDELLEDIKNDKIDFDLLIATPMVMAKLGQLAKILGPRGLMPSPKSGTVTTDIAKAVNEAKAGRIEYRVDAQGIIHSPIGKVSFGDAKLTQNAEALLTSIRNNKPNSIKGSYFLTVYVTTTMGPSIAVIV